MLIIKKIAVFFVLTVLAFQALKTQAFAVSTSAASAVLTVCDTGEVLYEKDAHKHRPMASTTKIMTAYIALRQGTPERVVNITKNMLAEGTSMGLKAGDKITLSGLVYGMLLQSGNDAANAAAIAIAGSIEGFADMMNEEAKRLQMKDTHFVTPSGLDAQEHYTTAYDMALLASAAADMPEFLAVCSQKSARVSFVEPQTARYYENHNRLLYSYDGAVGMKTGFTKKSGRCLVSVAERDGVKLAAVTLNDGDDWNDHIKMLDYGYSVVKTQKAEISSSVKLKVIGGQKDKISVKLSENAQYVYTGENKGKITYKILMKPFEYAPVNKDEIIGELRILKDGTEIENCDILSAENSEALTTDEARNYQNRRVPWYVRLWRAITRSRF